MRLSLKEQQFIKQTIYRFDPNAMVYLFGSRVDDSKKGGDIDLLILSAHLSFTQKRQIKIKLYELIGEQQIDLILAKDTSDPFIQVIFEEAVLL
jgi:predicted nucleotidyltransferase